jgi:hypothetical protein
VSVVVVLTRERSGLAGGRGALVSALDWGRKKFPGNRVSPLGKCRCHQRTWSKRKGRTLEKLCKGGEVGEVEKVESRCNM